VARRRLAWAVAAAAALGWSASSLPAPATAADTASCARLAGLHIRPAEIGLPSRGAVIDAAAVGTAPANPQVPDATIEYCRLTGRIAPVDPQAPDISVEINLPLVWNGKAVQYGGGGFNGVLITGLAPLRDAPRDLPTPLARGYATFGTDSGHQATALPEIQAFALNEEALVNFAYAAYKKTRDMAAQAAIAFYGHAPARVYYVGGSEGGREGLAMAQRFPADYDGIISVVPVINWVGLIAASNRSGIAQRQGGWLSPAKVSLLRKAVLATCDAMDGIADGVVSRYEACIGAFDPRKLRCADGHDAGDACLSEAQVAAVETLHRPYDFGFAVANGITAYPGWNYGSEDQPDGMIAWITGTAPAEFPVRTPQTQGRQWYFGNGGIRYFIAGDARFDPLTFRPGAFTERIRQISALMDATSPDLDAFRARGGKLILKENAADFAQSPFEGIDYYKSAIARMGAAQVERFLRFYVTPGASHSGAGISSIDGAPLPQGVDLLGALDQWVSEGTAPETLIQTDQAPAPPFTLRAARPLCRYPLYPRYRGGGDPHEAASFVCSGG
jgi:Tannase and feruloyl esterase